MMIDKYLAAWDFAKKNEMSVMLKTAPEASVLYQVDFSESRWIKLLFSLRGLPTRMLTLKGIMDTGFILLEESRAEIVIGLIARPWKLTGQIVTVPPEVFTSYAERDYVKVVWNFHMDQDAEKHVTISTETRIHCTSSKARRLFSIYWFMIGFFSGVIRVEMLKVIRNRLSRSA